MRPSELKKVRACNQISLIEMAATIGLPAGYLEQIENEEVIALESDLVRIEKGLHFILENRRRDEQDEDEKD